MEALALDKLIAIFIKKKDKNNFQLDFFLQCLIIKTRDPDWIHIRIRSLEMLDPDPYLD